MEIRTIGIILGDRIGDAMISIPLVRGLKLRYPDAKIILIFQRDGLGRKILTENLEFYKEFTFSIDHKITDANIKKILKTLLLLRKEKFDLLIDAFPSTTRTAILSRLLRAKKRIGNLWLLNKHGRFFYDSYVDGNREKCIEINRKIFLLSGGENSLYKTRFEIKKKRNIEIEKIFSKGKMHIAVFLGSKSDSCRVWDVKKWAVLLNMIKNEFKNIEFISIGSAREKEMVNELRKLVDFNIRDATGIDIYETAYLLGKCDFFIGTDGGPVHIAGSMDIPSIVIMGNEPLEWESFPSIKYIRSGRECYKYCWKNNKKGFCTLQKGEMTCTDFIPPEQVFSEAKKVLSAFKK